VEELGAQLRASVGAVAETPEPESLIVVGELEALLATYLQGDKGLPRDLVQAEMWLRLAAENNLDFYQNELLGAEGQMTADQIAKGKALAAAWKPKVAATPKAKAAQQTQKN
jgi:hypothetical protein